jgi:hypothetical protein
MSESTVTKSKVFVEDMALATGGTGASEEGTRITSTGGEATLTKIDASHIKFKTLAKSLNDLVDGGQDVHIKPSSITMDGTLTNDTMTLAGYVKNSAAGALSGGNSIAAGDLPTAINAANIADGSVTNIEFQYLANVTSDIQTQINAAAVPASQGEQETGTATNRYVSPGRQQYHQSAAKAWVKVNSNGGGAITYSGYNISGVVRNSSGDISISFTIPFSSTDYVVSAMLATDNTPNNMWPMVRHGGQAVGSVRITTADYDNNIAEHWDSLYVVCYGDFS